MTYEWKAGARIKVKANVAGERIEQLREERGGIVTPEVILEDARNPDSPLHPAFVWNDDEAAEKYRMQQAYYLLRSLVVRVKIKDSPSDGTPTRFYVVVTDELSHDPGETMEQSPRHVYMDFETALMTPELRDQVLDRALRELENLRKRYGILTELARVFEAVEIVEKERRTA